MYNTIELAREALTLFLYSLPTGSMFNVCSYGTNHEFIFNERSVDYNDMNLAIAVAKIAEFGANFGGTRIY